MVDRTQSLTDAPSGLPAGAAATTRAEPVGALVLRTTGPVIGRSRTTPIYEIVYVVPERYCELSWRDRREVARLVQRVVHAKRARAEAAILLIGPGRWGTDTPELGVPVTIADIDRVSALCECFCCQEGLVPDASLGSHFFGDLVERDILYLGVHLGKDGHFLDRSLLAAAPNALSSLVGDADQWNDVLRVVEPPEDGAGLWLRADARAQAAACYFAG